MPKKRILEQYSHVIAILRDKKKFSFREIADWLDERGIECDHNAVYRQYCALQADDPGLYNDWEREEEEEEREFNEKYGL